jgi:serine/threonine-protein kinase
VDDLERWTRVLPLGTGAFGEVHLAWDRVDARWVALKRFTGQDELGLLRFVIESRIRVSHPHLVRTLAFRLVDDRAWLVTELARGGSLRMLTSRTGALPWGWVAEAVDQVLSALTALHATGVVHRDLKPANLLLRSHGQAAPPHLLVGDFGIATWRTVSMTGVGAAIGTPGYLAPEYLDGRQPSPATDLFAVGVLAAELLTGRRLVHHSNDSPAMPSSWDHTLPLPDSVPAHLSAVLRRMADPDPARRYVDCTQAREALLAAAPPHAWGDLTTVPVPDLLAAVPPGWTPEGPEAATTTLPAALPASAPSEVSTHPSPPPIDLPIDLPIDGGPTALVGGSATPAPPPMSENGSATPPADPATGPAPPTDLASGPATPPSPAASPSGRHTPAAGVANRSGAARGGPVTPPRGSAASPSSPRPQRHRVRRAVLVLVLLLLAGAGGTLWWAATHRGVGGEAIAGGRAPREAGRWVPVLVAPCSQVELDRTRSGAEGDERCQRVRDEDRPQYWVREPAGGFPKSDAAGPFPGEPCGGTDGDTRYSPVGDQLVCTAGEWRAGT